MKQAVNSKRGEMYIDVAIMVLCAMMLIVLALNTFSFFVIKQDLDYYTKEMIKVAIVTGKTTGKEIDNRKAELNNETGMNPVIAFNATYFNESERTVQFGNTIAVTITFSTQYQGFGLFSIPVSLKAKHSGLSQRYWK